MGGQCHAFVSIRTSRRVDASMLHLHVTSVCIRGVPSGEEVESTVGDRGSDLPMCIRETRRLLAFLDSCATRAARRDATRREAR